MYCSSVKSAISLDKVFHSSEPTTSNLRAAYLSDICFCT
nr:MAG TPA: hypothetical protein [Caudoviricetes sp.]